MKHYKVVRREGDELVSCLMLGHARVAYKINEWVNAPAIFAEHGYHVTVFTNLRAAEEFMVNLRNDRTRDEIYEVKVCGIVDLPEYRYEIVLVPSMTIPELEKCAMSFLWPHYTRMARKVKLVNLIE